MKFYREIIFNYFVFAKIQRFIFTIKQIMTKPGAPGPSTPPNAKKNKGKEPSGLTTAAVCNITDRPARFGLKIFSLRELIRNSHPLLFLSFPSYLLPSLPFPPPPIRPHTLDPGSTSALPARECEGFLYNRDF